MSTFSDVTTDNYTNNMTIAAIHMLSYVIFTAQHTLATPITIVKVLNALSFVIIAS